MESERESASVGCPRNNQIFFSVRTEANRKSICFGPFLVCFAKTKNIFFGLFWCFRHVSKQPKQTEFCRNNPKKSPKKRSLLGGPQNREFFFSVRTETNRNSICFGCFSVCFFTKPTNFFSVCFCLLRCFGPVLKQPKQTELIVWGIKKVDILTNLLLFRLVFCLFRLFQNTETPCFGIKANQPKQTSCFG
jgi:hypothetical protein